MSDTFDWGDDDFERRAAELEGGLERIRDMLRDGKVFDALEEIERTLHPNYGCGGSYEAACNGNHPFLRVGGDHGKN